MKFTDEGLVVDLHDTLCAFELEDSSAVREASIRGYHDSVLVEETDDGSSDGDWAPSEFKMR